MEKSERRQATIRETLDCATIMGLRKLLSECVGGIASHKTEIHNAAATLDNGLLGLLGQICGQRYINIKVVSSAVEHFLAEIEEADGKYDNGLEIQFNEEQSNGNP